MTELSKVKITSNTEILPNTFILKFKRTFDFKAGQIIGLKNNTDISPRLYSICSSPSESEISILYSIKIDGELTPSLASAKAGDSIWITPVQGEFLFNNEPAWWIATGTGIAPFYAMFKSKQKPLKLIQGGRKTNDFIFQEKFTTINSYIKCCSQEPSEGYYNGRMTNYIKNLSKLPSNINYYICGSAEMVVDVRNLLINKGVNFNRIITEIYF